MIWETLQGKHVKLQQSDGFIKYGDVEYIDSTHIFLRFRDGRLQGIRRANIIQIEIDGVSK